MLGYLPFELYNVNNLNENKIITIMENCELNKNWMLTCGKNLQNDELNGI